MFYDWIKKKCKGTDVDVDNVVKDINEVLQKRDCKFTSLPYHEDMFLASFDEGAEIPKDTLDIIKDTYTKDVQGLAHIVCLRDRWFKVREEVFIHHVKHTIHELQLVSRTPATQYIFKSPAGTHQHNLTIYLTEEMKEGNNE